MRFSRGFTLLEVLVAVSLLALMLALGYAGIRVAIRSARGGEALIERTDEIRVAQEFLRHQLSNALPLIYEQLEDSGEQKRFEASAQSVRFVAPMPGHLARGGPHVQWLALAPGSGGMLRLEFDHAQLNGYDPKQPKADGARPPVILLENIAQGRFEFRDIDPQTGELGDWTEEWEEPLRLPQLVRLSLEFKQGDRRRWPPFEVPLRVAQSMGAGFGVVVPPPPPRGNRQ